jgi:hypothetical protein
MKTILEKIEAGKIRIEGGKLIGLGDKGNESIDIEALNELMNFPGKSQVSDALTSAIQSISNIQASAFEMDEGPELQFLNNVIIPVLPDPLEIHILSLLNETLQK